MKTLLIALTIVQATCSMPRASELSLPPIPGEADPALTKAIICDPSWSTRFVRPPTSFTAPLKRKLMAEQHLPGDPSDYELDHLIPLELGGAPRSEKNLWMEPMDGSWNARDKDRLERKLHELVCAGKVDLEEAQQDIATHWVAAYVKYVHP